MALGQVTVATAGATTQSTTSRREVGDVAWCGFLGGPTGTDRERRPVYGRGTPRSYTKLPVAVGWSSGEMAMTFHVAPERMYDSSRWLLLPTPLSTWSTWPSAAR